ncbi:M60 family metallopeptidase [Streptomyces sp. H27-G5]|uniref:M60 family metallopeptidase n=1 Tax=Streptomyces sp. H27-G5 TaxID=2996698 RepID=UPI002271F569|nr:M60 family metallopeptidase [Streptomyces sp. H27-G5]MCY0924264.1 M60 family metallopeptidase [Streptomyces sp. H27-G5]
MKSFDSAEAGVFSRESSFSCADSVSLEMPSTVGEYHVIANKKAGADAGAVDQCLRLASGEGRDVVLGPVPDSADEDAALAQWKAEQVPGYSDRFLLVNRYLAEAGLEECCLINVGWEPKIGKGDPSRSESAWIPRKLQAGYIPLQNAYSSENRCLAAEGTSVKLSTCTEEASATALWSADFLPHPPSYHQDQPEKFPQPRSLTISSLPSAESECERVGQKMWWADWQPTGFYLNPLTELTVDVAGDLGGATLELVVGTPSLVEPWDTELAQSGTPVFHRLMPGANTVADLHGGILSLRYVTETIDQHAPDAIVALGPEAEPIPFFRKETTGNEQWRTMLDVSKVPVVELAGERVVVTVSLDSARQAVVGDMDAVMSVYDQGTEAQNAIAGLDGDTPRDRPSPLHPMLVETRTGVNPNAARYRGAFSYPAGRDFLAAGSVRDGWGYWHEFGHHRQSIAWNWDWNGLGEVTVNIYTMAALRLWHDPSAFPGVGVGPGYWNQAVIYLAKPDQDREFDNGDTTPGLIKMVMFEQLRVAFGDSFYPNLEKTARPIGDPGSVEARKKLFQVQASMAAARNLSEYFIKWGLRPDQETLDSIAALNLPKPDKDPTAVPVFGGSEAGRVLGGMAFWTDDRGVHVTGQAYPQGAAVEALNAQGRWVGIGRPDTHLAFENDHLTTEYLADGQTLLTVRVNHNGTPSDPYDITVVDKPGVSELSAVRMVNGQILVTGRGTPAGVGAEIAVNPSFGSWPLIAPIRGDGTFEHDHLRADWLYREDTLRVRVEYENQYYGPYDATVVEKPYVLDVSAVRSADGKVSVTGNAAPAGAPVQALNSSGNWVGIAIINPDGTFANPNLNNSHLADGTETLRVRVTHNATTSEPRETKVTDSRR